jgi:hypothetical protein
MIFQLEPVLTIEIYYMVLNDGKKGKKETISVDTFLIKRLMISLTCSPE